MSLRKPILKVTRECRYCKGSGSKTIKEKYNYYSKKLSVRDNCYVIVACKKCDGTGYIDIKHNDPKFKKYYQKALEERIGDLTTEYRRAKTITGEIGEELNKHSKELDKVVNRQGGIR